MMIDEDDPEFHQKRQAAAAAPDRRESVVNEEDFYEDLYQAFPELRPGEEEEDAEALHDAEIRERLRKAADALADLDVSATKIDEIGDDLSDDPEIQLEHMEAGLKVFRELRARRKKKS